LLWNFALGISRQDPTIIFCFAAVVAASLGLIIGSRFRESRDPEQLPSIMSTDLSFDPRVAEEQLLNVFTAQGQVQPVVKIKSKVVRVTGRQKSARAIASLRDRKERIIDLKDGTPCFEVVVTRENGEPIEMCILPGSATPFRLIKPSGVASLADLGEILVSSQPDYTGAT
jgi:hypothetical protein